MYLSQLPSLSLSIQAQMPFEDTADDYNGGSESGEQVLMKKHKLSLHSGEQQHDQDFR